MSRKSLIYFLLAALVAAAAVIGVVATRAQGSTKLPSIAPAALLSKVAGASRTPTPVSGNITWTNGLVPGPTSPTCSAARVPLPAAWPDWRWAARPVVGPAGRRRASRGPGQRLRLCRRGQRERHLDLQFGDERSRALPAARRRARPVDVPEPGGLPGRSARGDHVGVQRFASTGTVTVSGQQTVAGRESYILTVTPASGAQTTFGSVQVAVDGSTFVPLQVQVYAKGDSTPVLSAGFTKVSYAKNATSLFSFTPPAGATVQHKALPAMTNAVGGMTTAPAASPKHVGLTLVQAQAKATANGLTLVLPAKTASLPFEGAVVTPGSGGRGASAVLHYGRGFGSVMLAESAGATGSSGSLTQQLSKLPQGLLATTTIGGVQARELTTSLVNAIVWQRGSTTVVAAGMVPATTLQQVVAGAH